MFEAMRSGRNFRGRGRRGPEYSPLIEPPLSDDEEATQASLQSAIQLIKQGFSRISHPPTPPPSSPTPLTPLPTPLPPPPLSSMVNSIKMLVFKGLGNENLDQFWFVAKAVWEA